jgi:predicted alpha/beta-fold hydrolase
VQTLPIDLLDGDMVVAQVRAGGTGSVAYLLPGLQGSVRASYLALCAKELLARGWAVVGLNGRGCGMGRGLARLPSHAGDTLAPGTNSRTVLSANDLNPRRVSDRRNIARGC